MISTNHQFSHTELVFPTPKNHCHTLSGLVGCKWYGSFESNGMFQVGHLMTHKDFPGVFLDAKRAPTVQRPVGKAK